MAFTFLKNRAVGLLGISPVSRLVAALSGDEVAIVMLHRFLIPGGTHDGTDPVSLGRTLAELRNAGVELVSVEQVVADWDAASSAGDRKAGRRSPRVAFTVDDGYADALDVAAPVFADFDCPVTCFVVPEVVEGREWFWWDKVDHMLRRSGRKQFDFEVSGIRTLTALGEGDARRAAYFSICESIKKLPAETVPDYLAQLSAALDVPIPESAPDVYRVLGWEAMREAERKGWRFGAHTMTHPVVGRCTDERAEWEIGASVQAVRANLQRPSELFCYPVGRDGDFGTREFQILQRHGVKWALSAVPGRVPKQRRGVGDLDWRLRLPRFAADVRPGGVLRMFLD